MSNPDEKNSSSPSGSSVPPQESHWYPRDAILESWATKEWTEGIQIDQLDALESLCVRTQNSVYEITVVCPNTGEVLIRGGQFFPQRTPATLAGSSLGGSFLKLRGIYMGYSMEIHHDRQTIITSRVRSIGLVTE